MWWHNSSLMITHSIEAQYFAVLLFCHQSSSTLELLSFMAQRRHQWGGNCHLPCPRLSSAEQLNYIRGLSLSRTTLRHTTKRKEVCLSTLSEIHNHALWTSPLYTIASSVWVWRLHFLHLFSPWKAWHWPNTWCPSPGTKSHWKIPQACETSRLCTEFKDSTNSRAALRGQLLCERPHRTKNPSNIWEG